MEATKSRRDSAEVERTLAELSGRATDANLMPPILDCARARVSEGEMVEALQQVFGHLHRATGLLGRSPCERPRGYESGE